MKPITFRYDIDLAALKKNLIIKPQKNWKVLSPSRSPLREDVYPRYSTPKEPFFPVEIKKIPIHDDKDLVNEINKTYEISKDIFIYEVEYTFTLNCNEEIMQKLRDTFFIINSGLNPQEQMEAWHTIERSAALFGVTTLFPLYEFIKNSLEEEASQINITIHADDNGVTCEIIDNGRGFLDGRFAQALDESKEEAVDYRAAIVKSDSKIKSDKAKDKAKDKDKDKDEDVFPLPQINENIGEHSFISVGGAGMGMAHTMAAMELGDGHLKFARANTRRLDSFSTFRPEHGAAIILTSPLFDENTVRRNLRKHNAYKAAATKYQNKPFSELLKFVSVNDQEVEFRYIKRLENLYKNSADPHFSDGEEKEATPKRQTAYAKPGPLSTLRLDNSDSDDENTVDIANEKQGKFPELSAVKFDDSEDENELQTPDEKQVKQPLKLSALKINDSDDEHITLNTDSPASHRGGVPQMGVFGKHEAVKKSGGNAPENQRHGNSQHGQPGRTRK